MIGLSIRR